MTRWFFFILLAANVLLFAVMQLGGGRSGESMTGHEPIRGEQIKLLGETPVTAQKVDAPAVVATCFQWGDFSGADINRATQALAKLQLGEMAVRQNVVQPTGGWWVYMPPRPSLAEAQKKLEELKRLGVVDGYVIQGDTKWRYAISLGAFGSEEGAAKFLAQLKNKGVKSAVAGQRMHETDAVRFRIKAMGNTAVAELKREFPDSQLNPMECNGAAP